MCADGRPRSEEERRLAELMRSEYGDLLDRPFQPFVAYHRGMDRLFVQTRDCSICEESRPGSLLILFRDNHPKTEEEEYIGFAIEPASRFYEKRQLEKIAEYPLSTLLDEVMDEFPDLAEQVAIARLLAAKVNHQGVALI